MNQQQPIRDARTLGVPKMLLLGLQHMFAMFGATILVPILTNLYFVDPATGTSYGLSIQVTLICAGLGTLFFHACAKLKVPAFLGSSFAFLGGFQTIANLQMGIFKGMPMSERLPYACGGVFVAGIVYLIIAGLIKLFGIKKIMRFFPPVVTGPIIIAIGLTLAPTAINNCRTDWLLAVIAVVLIIVCNIWGRGMVRIIPIIIGVVGSYIVAVILGRVDFTPVTSAGIVSVPLDPNMFAKFDISAIITIVPIALATVMEHIGDISAIGATTGENYIANPGLHRTICGDGLATMIAAFFGAPANTTYGENTGVLAMTNVHDPKVVRLAAVFAVILSFFPAVAGVITSIPAAIVGGVSLILYGMISAIGVRNMVENHVDLALSRNMIISASILVCALGFKFADVTGLSFTIGTANIEFSGLAIAAIVGILLNAVLPGNTYEFSAE